MQFLEAAPNAMPEKSEEDMVSRPGSVVFWTEDVGCKIAGLGHAAATSFDDKGWYFIYC
jgi:hypothetical protein